MSWNNTVQLVMFLMGTFLMVAAMLTRSPGMLTNGHIWLVGSIIVGQL